MNRVIKCQVLIVGGGAAGLNAALNINANDVILIERNSSNSLLSRWNIKMEEENKLKREILKAGNKINDLKLLEVFLNGYEEAIDDLKKIGIKLRKSNIGLIPDYKAPALEIKRIFLKEFKKRKKNIRILKGKVTNFLTDKEEKIKGVTVNLPGSPDKARIFFNYLILAAGGINGFFPFSTGTEDCDGSILSLCYESGFLMRDLEFLMFHPFFIIDKKFPKTLISGKILSKMEFEDENKERIFSEEISIALRNNRHHNIFPQMNREAYLKSCQGKIFGKIICSEKWFERYKKEDEFGFIFSNFKRKEVKKIEICPTFHFSIGGLVINKNTETNHENIYAAGEIVGGLHGSSRIGGLGVLEALVFGKKAAIAVNQKIKKHKTEINLSVKIKEKGKLGLSDKIKKMAWEALGPVKAKTKIEQLKFALENRELTSQEKLLKKIAEISLKRKSSIGEFFKEDLPTAKKSQASFLIKDKIFFK